MTDYWLALWSCASHSTFLNLNVCIHKMSGMKLSHTQACSVGCVWGHPLRIVRNNTVRADAKSESLGFSLLEVVSLAPPFTFYNHRIVDFKLEGILKGHPVQSPGIIIFILQVRLSCHYCDISVIPWCR